MTDAQILQVFGIVYVAAGVGMLASPKSVGRLLEGFSDNPALLFLGGIISIPLGYVFVAFHNTWNAGVASTLVTLLGWAILIKGVLLLVLPGWYTDMTKKLSKMKVSAWFSWVALLLGIILIGLGYFS